MTFFDFQTNLKYLSKVTWVNLLDPNVKLIHGYYLKYELLLFSDFDKVSKTPTHSSSIQKNSILSFFFFLKLKIWHLLILLFSCYFKKF